MMRAVLLATHDKCSDAEASRRTRVDLDCKAAMWVDRDFRGIGATTFSLFRVQLVLHDAECKCCRPRSPGRWRPRCSKLM